MMHMVSYKSKTFLVGQKELIKQVCIAVLIKTMIFFIEQEMVVLLPSLEGLKSAECESEVNSPRACVAHVYLSVSKQQFRNTQS
jgi:hypothetical protein